jgi:hypothetical protein
MNKESDAEHYAKPENRRIVGPPQRLQAHPQLSNHVSIRFAPTLMGWVRMLATRDGVTVGSWIRSAVEREVERRLPFARTGVTTYELHVSLQEPVEPSRTANPGGGDVPSTFELVLTR